MNNELIFEMERLLGYNIDEAKIANHLSGVKEIEIGLSGSKFHIDIEVINENKIEITIKTLCVFSEEIHETQILEDEETKNLNLIIRIIARMERIVLGKVLNQVNAMSKKLNYILNYR
jgi:hypothetical protein